MQESARHRWTAAFAITVLALIVPQANAGSGGGCATGNMCVYENNDFNNGNTDHWRDFTADDGDFTNNNWLNNNGSDSGDGMDNETSSIRNRVGCTARLWQHVGSTGAASDFSNGSGSDDGMLSNNNIGDNRASAIDKLC